MSDEHDKPSDSDRSGGTPCYAILRDGVYEGVEHFRGHAMIPGGAELVNFEFTKPNGHRWRGDIPATSIFADRDSAEAEWKRKYA